MSKSQVALVRRSDEELLQCYLDLSTKERDARFAEVSRAAQLTGISPRTIQRWAKQHRIQAIFIAERYRIEINSLYNYIKQRAWARGD
jgi:excisionase family DNA binding protein